MPGSRMFTRRDYDLELDSIVFTSVSILPSAVTLSAQKLKSHTSLLTAHLMTIRNYKEKIVGEKLIISYHQIYK